MNAIATIILLIVSNIFMTFAWYGHLETTGRTHNKPVDTTLHCHTYIMGYSICRILLSGARQPHRLHRQRRTFSLMQLKVIQEAITLVVFTIFTVVFFRGETLHWNHLAAFVCLIAAVYFVFMK